MSDNWIYRRIVEFIIVLMAIYIISLLFWYPLFSLVSAIIFGLCPIILYYGYIHPSFFCLIFYAFSIFRLHEVIPVLYPYQIPFVSATLAILSLTLNVLLNRMTLYWQKEMGYFLVFFLFITLGVPLSYDFELSYNFWSDLFLKIGIIFFMVTWSITDKTAYKSIITLTITCGVFISFITIYNKFYNINLIEGTRASVGGQARSLIGDPNDLALTLLFPFSFCCSLFLTKSKSILLRLAGLLSSLIIIDAIIVTQSRGGLLGLCGVIGYFFTRRVKSKLLLILMIIGVALFLFIISNISTRQSGGAGQWLDESAMGRINAWKTAINMAIHHPIWGIGLNGFQDNYFNYAIVWDRINLAVHSSWFGILAETGFLGLALFIVCVYQAMKLAHRNIRIIDSLNFRSLNTVSTELILAQSLYAGLIGFCISSTFLTQGFSWPFYIFFALSISLSHNINTRKNLKGLTN